MSVNNSKDPGYYRVFCPDHPDAPLIEDYRAGDQICSCCGLVVGDRVIDVGKEWRSLSNETSKSDPCRVGGAENPLLNGSDLTTIIGPSPGSSYFGDSTYANRRSTNNANKALTSAFRDISNMADKINLAQSIVDRANSLFKQIHDGKNLKGKSHGSIATACLYIACRQEHVPRTFKEICAVSRTNKKEIGRCFKLILKVLETSLDVITTEDFMNRFCSNLGLTAKVQRAATRIANKAVEFEMVPGRSPISVAAAAIYMASQASKNKKTQKEIGEVVGVADATIRQTYKLLRPRANDLFPENFEFETPIELLPS